MKKTNEAGQLHCIDGPAYIGKGGARYYVNGDFVSFVCPNANSPRRYKQSLLDEDGIKAVIPCVPTLEQQREHGLTVTFTPENQTMEVRNAQGELHNPVGPARFSFVWQISYYRLDGNTLGLFCHRAGANLIHSGNNLPKVEDVTPHGFAQALASRGVTIDVESLINLSDRANVPKNTHAQETYRPANFTVSIGGREVVPYTSSRHIRESSLDVPIAAPKFIPTTARERQLDKSLGMYKLADMVIKEPKWVDARPELSDHAISALQRLVG